jgi:hypothetical protein
MTKRMVCFTMNLQRQWNLVEKKKNDRIFDSLFFIIYCFICSSAGRSVSLCRPLYTPAAINPPMNGATQ